MFKRSWIAVFTNAVQYTLPIYCVLTVCTTLSSLCAGLHKWSGSWWLPVATGGAVSSVSFFAVSWKVVSFWLMFWFFFSFWSLLSPVSTGPKLLKISVTYYFVINFLCVCNKAWLLFWVWEVWLYWLMHETFLVLLSNSNKDTKA